MGSSVDQVIGLHYYINNNRREESIVRLIEKDTSWIFNFGSSSRLYVYEKASESFWRTNSSYNRQGSNLTLCVQKTEKERFLCAYETLHR